jgi:cupin fold WbuC family metalloprotein
MIAVTKESPEVYYAAERLSVVGPAEIAFLKQRAFENPRKRCRLCTHASPDDEMQEMLIVHHRECYVRPHRHRRKAESLHVIEGAAEVVVFDERGAVSEAFEVAEGGSPASFYYRMPPMRYHMLIIKTEWFVFHEVVRGPFVRGETEFPHWAPDGAESAPVAAFLATVADLFPERSVVSRD